jgi:formamidopyrimidine-DNA glycosylase
MVAACAHAGMVNQEMPELPEVETVRRGLAPAMEGARFEHVETRRGDLRTPFPRGFARRLTGRKVTGLGRRAKYLLADLDDGEVLLMHLGMSGSFRVEAEEDAKPAIGSYYHARPRDAAHDHVVFRMSNGARIVYNDPRRFGQMDLVPREKLDASRHFKKMGVEPLGNAFDADVLAHLFAKRKAPLKAALSDQRLVAGLGNIYVCEALWRAKLSPRRRAGTIADRKGAPNGMAKALATAIRAVLNDAIAAGGSSLRDHARTDGELGDFQHHFSVYDREGAPCARRDGGTIRRIVQSGRSTFYCPVCQK